MLTDDMIFTSESVTRGHPDKLCDEISDAIVDAFRAQDAGARIVAECAIATGVVFVAARFSGEAAVDIPALARRVIAEAGYEGAGFDARQASILTSFSEGDGLAGPLGADEPAHEQVNAFGFACRDTALLMPAPIAAAHRLARALEAARGAFDALAPDGKVQVSVRYRGHRPVAVTDVSLSTALLRPVPPAQLEEALRALVLAPAFADADLALSPETRVHVNPGGSLLFGGPAHHAGQTGRKAGIDTYGDFARQSGSALCGKGPHRIDRIGPYVARLAAKAVVAAGLAERAEVHAAYAIGRAEPLSLTVDTFGTGRRPAAELARALADALDWRPGAVAARLGFDAPSAPGFFRALACYGQVGRDDLALPWEDTEALAQALRAS
ncbi:MAG: methionine adenosyltransferase domain-containing protein [Pseudomonadota bacterium]